MTLRQRLTRRFQHGLHALVQWAPFATIRATALRFSRPQIYVGDHTVMTRTIFGHPIFLDTRDVHIFPRVAFYGVWEPHVTDVILRRVRPGMHAVDVGANVGYHTMVMAAQVLPGGRVTAVEANPRMCGLLRRSLAASGHGYATTVVEKALLDEPGEVELRQSVFHPGSSSLYPLESAFEFGAVDRFTVPATTLDACLGETDGRVDFIKMDVEGAEPLVFAGMATTLERNPGLEIVMEFSRERFAHSGHSAQAFVDFLVAEGFRFDEILPRARLRRLSPGEVLALDFADLLLTRRG